MKIGLTLVIVGCLTLANGQMYDQLYDFLFDNYNKYTIPIRSAGDTLNVTFSMSLVQLNSLNQQTGDTELTAWLTSTWTDDRLKWPASRARNISIIRVPYTQVWNPDILLYNGHTEADPTINAVIRRNGGVTTVIPVILKTRCGVTYDGAATCHLKMGSWTHDGNLLNVSFQNGGMDMSEYTVNGRWELVRATAKRNVVRYPCCPEPYITLEYKILFQRRGWSLF